MSVSLLCSTSFQGKNSKPVCNTFFLLFFVHSLVHVCMCWRCKRLSMLLQEKPHMRVFKFECHTLQPRSIPLLCKVIETNAMLIELGMIAKQIAPTPVPQLQPHVCVPRVQVALRNAGYLAHHVQLGPYVSSTFNRTGTVP